MRFRLPTGWGERSGYVLTAFLLGVGTRSVDPLHSWAGSWRMMLCAVVAGAMVLVIRAFGSHIRFIATCVLATCLGLWRFDVSIPTMNDGLLPWMDKVVTVYGDVTDVERAPFGTSVVIDADMVERKAVHGPGHGIRIVLGRSARVRPGDRYAISCLLSAPKPTPQAPKRQIISVRQGIWTDCRRMHVLSTSPASRLHPMALLFTWRQWLNARIDAALPQDEAALLKGILYGERSMSPELQESFRSAGLMHIIAVSGSNVSILSGVIFALVLGAGLRRRQAFWITTIVLIGFVAFVGLSASVLRAAWMGWLALWGRELGRLVSTRRLLLVAGAILCLWDPWQLVYDAGFALSFLATLGLLEVMPRLSRYLKWVPEVFGIRESIATTISTTLLTAPYLAVVFGRLALAGLVANVFALPLVPWAMLWGAFSAVFGQTTRYAFIHWPARGTLELLILIGRASQGVPWLDIHFDT